VYEDPSGRLEGRAAYQAMQRAATGTITITTVDGGAASVLPVVWRGDEQLVDAPSSTTGLARVTESLTARGADAAILLRVAGATGLRLISAGRILAEVPDRAGFEALVRQDGARLSVYFTEAVEGSFPSGDLANAGDAVLEQASSPDPSQPSTTRIAEEDWDQLLGQLCVYARSKLHRHSAHVEEIIGNTEHSLPAILAMARQLRELRPRVGNSRDVMEDIANQVDLVARQRVTAPHGAATEGDPEA
ncbi:MAG: hypothetical protein ACYDGR_11190, partial [Candidatus Dormibacteria bacterium]